jgi:hypothetical protein
MVDVLSVKIPSLSDSVASCCVLGKDSEEYLQKVNLPLHFKNVSISTVVGTRHAVQGCVDIPYLFNDKLKIIPTLVVPFMSQRLILGMDFWNALGIVRNKMSKQCPNSSTNRIDSSEGISVSP